MGVRVLAACASTHAVNLLSDCAGVTRVVDLRSEKLLSAVLQETGGLGVQAVVDLRSNRDMARPAPPALRALLDGSAARRGLHGVGGGKGAAPEGKGGEAKYGGADDDVDGDVASSSSSAVGGDSDDDLAVADEAEAVAVAVAAKTLAGAGAERLGRVLGLDQDIVGALKGLHGPLPPIPQLPNGEDEGQSAAETAASSASRVSGTAASATASATASAAAAVSANHWGYEPRLRRSRVILGYIVLLV